MGKVVIREAALFDISRMLESSEEFFNKSGYDRLTKYNPITVKKTLANLINDYNSICLLAEIDNEIVGGIGARLYPWLFNEFHRTGCEIFFWVDVRNRNSRAAVKLIKEVEARAKIKGADSFCMVSLESSEPIATGHLYEKHGYKLKEHFYYKKFNDSLEHE